MNHVEQFKSMIDIPDHMSVADYRQWVETLQGEVQKNVETYDKHEGISHGFELAHLFTPGLYTRELTIPAGSLIFSDIHIHEHPLVITTGYLIIYDGQDIRECKAPYKSVTMPGTKRIIYAVEDSKIMTFHATELKTVEEIEEYGNIVCSSFEQYEKIERGLKCLS